MPFSLELCQRSPGAGWSSGRSRPPLAGMASLFPHWVSATAAAGHCESHSEPMANEFFRRQLASTALLLRNAGSVRNSAWYLYRSSRIAKARCGLLARMSADRLSSRAKRVANLCPGPCIGFEGSSTEAVIKGHLIPARQINDSSRFRAGAFVGWASAHHASGSRLWWAEAHPTAASALERPNGHFCRVARRDVQRLRKGSADGVSKAFSAGCRSVPASALFPFDNAMSAFINATSAV